MMPTVQRLYDVVDGTWPAAGFQRLGPWMIREGQGGGQRVSAANAVDPVRDADIPQAEDAMQKLGQPRLFQIRQGDEALDAMLAARGYAVVDPVNIHVAPVDAVATERPPRITTFCLWEPLAIQIDMWAAGGIGPGRIAVMHRAKGPKTSLIGRLNDHPGGTGFVAMHDGIAMVHALEVLEHQRQQGMGRYFMREAAFWAQANGASHLSVVCTQGNDGANALYSSLGMTLVGQYHYRKHEEDFA
ncbi:GNAT family N-acetyltransferase [Lacimonas salitolerans]|uniref:GNAT family N-acetyltransferase n=2 Tax=Lacimonas salitolerans TaxID=1323750 RepID=A0ABW4EFW9_9RHOB